MLVNGVDVENFSPGDRAEARRGIADGAMPGDAFVFGIVGRFGPFKRHDVLIEAFNKIAAREPKAHLLIIGGGGPEEARIRALAAASRVAAKIHFAGLQHQLAPFYRAMDVLVVPSVNEGMSNAILEAMACGVPSLANKICGNAEMISHSKDGWLAPMDSPDALAVELARALASRAALDPLGVAARATALGKFSLRTMAGNYASLYRATASRRVWQPG